MKYLFFVSLLFSLNLKSQTVLPLPTRTPKDTFPVYQMAKVDSGFVVHRWMASIDSMRRTMVRLDLYSSGNYQITIVGDSLSAIKALFDAWMRSSEHRPELRKIKW
jgi:hypothetical protein